MLDVIQSLWVGPISPLERISMLSYVKQGHPFHLYTYDHSARPDPGRRGSLRDIPDGVVVKDANDIVPQSAIERFQNLANFSDFFRFSMLYQKGGFWSDLDVCCLKPYDFADPYVLATQLVVQRTNDEVTTCVIKAPQGSNVMQWCLDQIAKTDTKRNSWAEIGPQLLLRASRQFKLEPYIKKHETFCPLNYFEAPKNVMGNGTANVEFGNDTYAVHLWHEESRRAKKDKFATYPNSLYDRLRMELGA